MIDIRTLADDEIITEPGFYNISLDRHHNQPCMTEERHLEILDGSPPRPEEVSVTSGILRSMELRTPADVWAFHQLNPDRWEKPETKALTLGRAMAAYIEGGEDQLKEEYFVLTDELPPRPTANMLGDYEHNGLSNFGKYAITPDNMPKKPLESEYRKWKEGEVKGKRAAEIAQWNEIRQSELTYLSRKDHEKLAALKFRVEFWKYHDEDPRDKLSPNDFKMISNMGYALSRDPAAAAAMGGIPEVTMAYQDDVTGLWVLSRPDNVSFDGTAVDYKKMNTKGNAFTHRLVDDRITSHGYDMQMALGAEAMERLTEEWPGMVGIVAQWDIAPHHVILREILEEDLRLAQFRNRRGLTRFAECLTSRNWPGPGEDIASYQRPDWQREMLLEQMNTAGVAP